MHGDVDAGASHGQQLLVQGGRGVVLHQAQLAVVALEQLDQLVLVDHAPVRTLTLVRDDARDGLADLGGGQACGAARVRYR